jgi:hypothetical protein
MKNFKSKTMNRTFDKIIFSLGLVGQKGITAGDCVGVKDALDAVEMNAQPAPNFNTEAPLCDAGMTPRWSWMYPLL